MGLESAGHPLEGFEAAAGDASAPGVEKLSGPGARRIGPKMLKALYQQEARSAQSAAKQIAHAALVVGVPVAAVLEQRPACLLKQGSQSGAGEGMDLRVVNLVDGFAEVLGTKAVKDMERGWQGFGDDAQIGLPEVRANEAHLLTARVPKRQKIVFRLWPVRSLPIQNRRRLPHRSDRPASRTCLCTKRLHRLPGQ